MELDNELKQKVKDVLSDKTGSLLGDYVFDADEIDALRDYFVYRVNGCNGFYSLWQSDIEIFIIVVVNKLRDWNKEWSASGFWPQVFKIFDDYYVEKIIKDNYTKFYDDIEDVFDKYERVLFRTKSNERSFVQTFLYQAMAPRVSFEHFVELAWRKYYDDLECDYSLSDSDFCEYVINCLANRINSSDDNGDTKFGSSFYQLRASFKYGVLQNKEKTKILLDKVLRAIDRVDRNSEDLSQDTLGSIITDVVNRKKKVEVRKNNNEVTHRAPGVVHSIEKLKPIISVDYSEHDKPRVYICFPRLILLGVERYFADFEVYLHNNGNRTLIKKFQRRFFKDNGESSFTLSAFSEDITDLLSDQKDSFKLEFVLKADDGSFYSSEKTFFRDYLVFSKEKEVRGNTKPGIYMVIAPQNLDSETCFKLFRPDNKRKLWKNHWLINFEDNDSIEYLDTETLFSRQGMAAQVRFGNEDLEPVNYVKVIKNDVSYDVYRCFSDIHIENNDNSAPDTIRAIHVFVDLDGNEQKMETRLSDLEIVNHRYLYSELDNGLSLDGFHSLQIIKLSPIGQNKYLLNKNYLIDRHVNRSISKIPYSAGVVDSTINLFGKDYKYQSYSKNENEIIDEEQLGLTIKVSNPYLFWSFGTKPDDIHFSSINLDKPIIISQIDSTNETIILNTSLAKTNLYFESADNLDKGKVYSVFKADEDKYLLSQFIASGHKKGMFFVKAKTEKLYLFAITDEPYKSKNVKIDDCLNETDDGQLRIDLSQCFIHDDETYIVKLVFDNKIELNDVPYDQESNVPINGIKDGIHQVRFEFSKNGIFGSGPYQKLTEETVEIGDVNKGCFDDNTKYKRQIALNTFFVYGEKKEKIKCKEAYITNIEFDSYDEEGDCKFTGILKSKNTKQAKIVFTHKGATCIADMHYMVGQDGSILKPVNYDKDKCCFTIAKAGEKVVEFKTVYYKRLGE